MSNAAPQIAKSSVNYSETHTEDALTINNDGGPSIKDLLTQLHQMGFSNTKLCMEAIRIKGKNLDDIIEYLVEKELPPVKPDQDTVQRDTEDEYSEVQHRSNFERETNNKPVSPKPSFGFEDEMNPWANYETEEVLTTRKPSISHLDEFDPFKRK